MRLNKRHPFVLGIDFGGTKVALATFDGEGTVLQSDRYAFAVGATADQIVTAAIVRAKALIERTTRIHSGGCAAVGVSSPGIVLPDRVLLAPNVPGWQELALAVQLTAGLGIEPVVGTDVKAAAVAELRWGSLVGHDHAIYLNLGTGIAAALVVNGSVLFGANGAAGELAYNLVDAEAEWLGVHAGRAPLEEVVSGKAIGDRGAQLTGVTPSVGPPSGSPSSGAAPAAAGSCGATWSSTEPSARRVFQLARTDPAAQQLIDHALRHLALHVANLAIAVDPSLISVGGGLMGAADSILPVLQNAVRAAVPFPPRIVPAHFRYDAALHGAAAMALDSLR